MRELSKIFWICIASSLISSYLEMPVVVIISLFFAGLSALAEATVQALKEESRD